MKLHRVFQGIHKTVRPAMASGTLLAAAGALALLVGLVFTAQTNGPESLPSTSASRPSPESQPATTPAAETQPTTAATTQPLAVQASPRALIAAFREALARGTPEGDALAATFLDPAQVDPVKFEQSGGEFARQLGEVLATLRQRGVLTDETLSAEPDAPTQIIGKDPLLVALERAEGGRWRFSASTVKRIPDMYAALTRQAAEPEVELEEPVAPVAPSDDPLRTPRSAVSHFQLSVNKAADTPSFYAAAMAAMDLSKLDPQARAERGAILAEQLDRVLQRLTRENLFDRSALPDDPLAKPEPIGKEPLLLILVRQQDGRWRFSAETVARIPAMHERALAPGPLVEPPPTAAAPPHAAATPPAAAPATPAAPPATPPAAAPTASPPVQAPARAGAALSVPEEFRSPRATMATFLKAMNADDLRGAVRALDLNELTELERQANAGVLAGKLLLVLNRFKLILFQDIPDDPLYPIPYQVLVNEYGRIEISRQTRGPREGEWLFSAATIRTIENLYAAWESKPVLPELQDSGVSFFRLPALWLRERIPAQLKTTILIYQNWQWFGIGIVLLVGVFVQRALALLLPIAVRSLVETETSSMLPAARRRAVLPLTLLPMLLAWWIGVYFLDLGAEVSAMLWRILGIALAVVGVFAFYRLSELVVTYFRVRPTRIGSRMQDVVLPLIQKTLNVLIAAVGIIILLGFLGVRVEPLLAGLGLGGLAFGLAAQDTLKNFFGSVNVALDRPFHVGDWIKIGAHEGSVESVGLRSSRLRSFQDTEIIIPNMEIMNAVIDNWGRRRYRRLSFKVGVLYSTRPEQLEAFCEGVRELIRRHPYTRKEQFHVYVNDFAGSSIDILIYCFLETPDWATELREKHRLLVDIIKLVGRLGMEFAFPTQTIDLPQPLGELAAKALAAAARDGEPGSAGPGQPPTDGASRGILDRLARGAPEDALRIGRKEAIQIITDTLGDPPRKPPPVSF